MPNFIHLNANYTAWTFSKHPKDPTTHPPNERSSDTHFGKFRIWFFPTLKRNQFYCSRCGCACRIEFNLICFWMRHVFWPLWMRFWPGHGYRFLGSTPEVSDRDETSWDEMWQGKAKKPKKKTEKNVYELVYKLIAGGGMLRNRKCCCVPFHMHMICGWSWSISICTYIYIYTYIYPRLMC